MKNILFVCVENSCRSQMAEAFAKIHGKHLISAYSAGSRPSGQVNPKAITSMQAISYDLNQHDSKALSDIPAVDYEYAITMGCGDECPLVNAVHRQDWAIPDPKHMDSSEFNAIRDMIEAKVLALINMIKNSMPSK